MTNSEAIDAACKSIRQQSGRIGVAESAGRLVAGVMRHDRYTVYGRTDDGKTLTVEYAGYREGQVFTGLPLGGPGWRPPIRSTMATEWFESVTIFE